MATGVPKIQLNDGNLMPAIGLGAFQGSYDYTCIFNWYPFRRKGIFASSAAKFEVVMQTLIWGTAQAQTLQKLESLACSGSFAQDCKCT